MCGTYDCFLLGFISLAATISCDVQTFSWPLVTEVGWSVNVVGVAELSWCVADLLLGSVVAPDPSSPGSGPGSSGPWST